MARDTPAKRAGKAKRAKVVAKAAKPYNTRGFHPQYATSSRSAHAPPSTPPRRTSSCVAAPPLSHAVVDIIHQLAGKSRKKRTKKQGSTGRHTVDCDEFRKNCEAAVIAAKAQPDPEEPDRNSPSKNTRENRKRRRKLSGVEGLEECGQMLFSLNTLREKATLARNKGSHQWTDDARRVAIISVLRHCQNKVERAKTLDATLTDDCASHGVSLPVCIDYVANQLCISSQNLSDWVRVFMAKGEIHQPIRKKMSTINVLSTRQVPKEMVLEVSSLS
jgi:hypothetical protein